MKLLDLEQYLAQHTYPGRGIVLGRTPDNDKVAVAYFIMGRSENSRNRIFEETEDGIRHQRRPDGHHPGPHPAGPLLSPRPEHPGLRAGRPQLHPPHLRRGEARLHL